MPDEDPFSKDRNASCDALNLSIELNSQELNSQELNSQELNSQKFLYILDCIRIITLCNSVLLQLLKGVDLYVIL